ncbi:hypothetical protein Adt_14662 [Abeliophyllum distichum]|uniref:Uncharacterized protein n=1 Tax=Abeliophyllum distichum TaxID=126358 RepID=A0ABD1U0A5_9LAMI
MLVYTNEIYNASFRMPKSNREMLQRNPRTCVSVDLNLTQISMEIKTRLDNVQVDQMCLKQSDEQHLTTNKKRRHSTRDRLSTTRVLEALGNGFLIVKSGQDCQKTCIRQPDE